jgi:hypothetical protein
MCVVLILCFQAVRAGQDTTWRNAAIDTSMDGGTPQSTAVQSPVAEAGRRSLRFDTGHVDVAWGLTGNLQDYRGRKEFDYQSAVPQGNSLWEQFWRWFWTKWSQLMSREGFRVGFKAFLWAASIGILLYAVLRVLGMEKVRFWMGAQGRGQGIRGEIVEDIHAIDYETSIGEAENEGRYRDAIRFHFLRSLKLMSDREVIRWNRNKTNIDYTRELSAHRLAGPFEQIRRIYEYAWYGEFPVSREDYLALHPYFSGFDKMVSP